MVTEGLPARACGGPIATARPQFSLYGALEEISPQYRSARHVLFERVAKRIAFRLLSAALRLQTSIGKRRPPLPVEAPAGGGVTILVVNFDAVDTTKMRI